jgi:hypothetical protein
MGNGPSDSSNSAGSHPFEDTPRKRLGKVLCSLGMNMTEAFNPLLVCQVVIMVLNGIKEAHNGFAVRVGGEGIHVHDGGNSKKLEMLVDVFERLGRMLLKYLGNIIYQMNRRLGELTSALLCSTPIL